MPAGVSWSVYLRFCTACTVSMFAGSQTVHMLYRPLDDLDALVEQEITQLKKELVVAIEKGDVKIKGVPDSN